MPATIKHLRKFKDRKDYLELLEKEKEFILHEIERLSESILPIIKEIKKVEKEKKWKLYTYMMILLEYLST